jgi:RimJ/RimL family protein N-acetyltransferase
MMNFPDKLTIRNHLDHECYFLCRADTFPDSPEVRSQIAGICNQHLVYDTLFKESMKGQPYPTSSAGDFLQRAKSGWGDNSFYVFLLVDKNSDILACIDIKSAKLDEAEIGYWSSNKRPGALTNSVIKICNAGFKLGFTRFVAYVKPDNQKSINVLSRAGFVSNADIEQRSDYESFANSV